MERQTCFGLIAACALIVAAMAGCQGAETASGVDAGGAAPPDGPHITEKEQRWLDAIKGLDFESGRGRLTLIPADDPERAADAYERGMVDLEVTNDPIAAIGHFRDALALGAETPIDVWRALGTAMHHEGREQWALASWRNVLDVRPNDTETRFKVAMLHWNETEQAQAVREMERVAEEDRDNWHATERLAVWAYYMGDYDAAWRNVHETRNRGGSVPAQFLPLLEAQMNDPQAGAID